MLPEMPGTLTAVISSSYAEKGRQWLITLPGLIGKIAEEWQLSVREPYPNLSYHYVAPCVLADGSEAVLKIGFPEENREMLNEVEALKHIDGRGMIKLLRFDPVRRAMLLEKLSPGEHLRTLFAGNETAVISIAIDLMRKIWRDPPPENHFPRLEDWFDKGFAKARKTSFPSEYIQKAGRIFEELNSSTGRRVLLHGDLHHWNILSAQREPYLVIDPKGITGNFGYEMSTFLINHRRWLESDPGVKEKLDAAIDEFAEAFEMTPVAVRKWTYAQSVLSAWWTFEENSDNWKTDLELAEIWEV